MAVRSVRSALRNKREKAGSGPHGPLPAFLSALADGDAPYFVETDCAIYAPLDRAGLALWAQDESFRPQGGDGGFRASGAGRGFFPPQAGTEGCTALPCGNAPPIFFGCAKENPPEGLLAAARLTLTAVHGPKEKRFGGVQLCPSGVKLDGRGLVVRCATKPRSLLPGALYWVRV